MSTNPQPRRMAKQAAGFTPSTDDQCDFCGKTNTRIVARWNFMTLGGFDVDGPFYYATKWWMPACFDCDSALREAIPNAEAVDR